MVIYNFRKIRTVPSAKDLIDIILSKTQRQTPTIVHPAFQIIRIREFYMRKVKFTAQNYRDRLQIIVEEFPQIDSIHPFYADLINILYDKDHYKLALGQINIAKSLIDGIGKEYVKLIKSADSSFRCKSLKRISMGRMSTLIRKQKATLDYLEQVRQHLSRLPVIDPASRTLIVAGSPNVGKSSFMNKITRANVEVQNYPFTTKSLFVGHFDYDYARWQAIDTPGILDQPLEDRNTIEMQSVAAMAHLKASVLFFIDISEFCGYSIAYQISLFESIIPLFNDKPIVVVLSKIDLKAPIDLDEESKDEIIKMAKLAGAKGEFNWGEEIVLEDTERSFLVTGISSKDDLGIDLAKNSGCRLLLKERVEKKMGSNAVSGILNRLQVSFPSEVDPERVPYIPGSVIDEKVLKKEDKAMYDEQKKARVLERDLEEEAGGFGAYNLDPRKNYILENDEWKFDVIPEFVDGKNILDYVDPDIDRRLEELQKEEDEILKEIEEQEKREEMLRKSGQSTVDDLLELSGEQLELLNRIRERRIIMRDRSRRERDAKAPKPTRTQTKHKMDRFREHLDEMGMDSNEVGNEELNDMAERNRETGAKRRELIKEKLERINEVVTIGAGSTTRKDRSRIGSRSIDPQYKGFKSNDELKRQKKKTEDRAKIEKAGKWAKSGFGDHIIPNERPKHLLSGKRGIGKTERR